ncbi:MAG TPA: glycoside hydrolase family 31 protein [Terriglobales bacterium]|nr:glycoside hydrolase family 31 protein [Terriglobales bacterium]
MRNFFWVALWLATAVSFVEAQPQYLNHADAVKALPDGVELAIGSSRLRITVLSSTVLRFRYSLTGSFPQENPFVVLQNAFPDLKSAPRFEHSSGRETLQTDALKVEIADSPLHIRVLDASGQPVAQDYQNSPVQFNGTAFRVWKAMPQDEHYFGLGDKAGPMDHRDQAFTMWNTDAVDWTQGSDPLYKSIPFFMAVRHGRAYGIFLNNTFRSSFEFGKQHRDAYSFGSEGGELDYYFFYGPSPKQVLESFTALVGRTPLPPKFVLGYQQSRYSYFPEKQVREIAAEFRVRKIPCDMLYLDIDYEDKYRSFTIDRERFPNFEQMVRDLDSQGFKIVPIVDVHLAQQPGYKPYDEGMQHDYFVKNADGSVYVGPVWPGPSVFPDLTRADVRKWYGDLYADFLKMGIRGFWNDMNEPAVFRYPEKTMPLDVVHSMEGRNTDHREVHNIFGMENVRATYEGMLRHNPDLRPYVLTRAGFAGTQRYAATWTGDNAATWIHYKLSVTDLLSMGLSGYPLVGVDAGGFAFDPTPELLTRWTELAMFLPIFRNHSAKGTRLREPWVDGQEHEAIRKRYIEERYRLFPYIYTSMEETSRTGVPLMRPMFLEFPYDPALETVDREFLFGPNILVAPGNETTNAYEVMLPAGTWYELWSGRAVSGKQMVKPSLDTLPAYVRAGSILPEQPVIQSTGEKPNGPLQLAVYPGPNCQGTLYDDDGNSFAYRRGETLRMSFNCEVSPQTLRVSILKPQGPYPPWWTAVQVQMFGVSHSPTAVSVNGNRVSDWKFDSGREMLTLEIPQSSTASEIIVRQ